MKLKNMITERKSQRGITYKLGIISQKSEQLKRGENV